MTTHLVDRRDQLFVLKEMLEVEKLSGFPEFGDFSTYETVLDEAHRFARAEFYPTLEKGDREGCQYDPVGHGVKCPECYIKPYKKFRRGGWLSMSDSLEVAGSGFPLTIGTAVSELFYASGFYIYAMAELSHAGAKVIEKYGSQAQKDLYMTRLFSGQWMGSMCLTEPQAGSDVGAIRTKAEPKGDGTYSISGTKIFITAGEQDLTENIIHMVLARVAGDPPGAKGLSLFIVPKRLSDENGRLGEFNDVVCLGIERKMGQHGLPTCTMAYGEQGGCTGYLLGQPGQGMALMFNMMNEQRLLVGLQGLSYSSAAFMQALNYSRNRRQGRSVYPEKRKETDPVPIIEHPDVKRMLLTMKASVEGCRALAYYTSLCLDYAGVTEGEESACFYGLVELLIPVLKAYLTNQAWEMTGLAIQCAGGYGYCSDYPFERLARDCKVASIYEGANGIQAMDLMFRKLFGNNLANLGQLMKRIDRTVGKAREAGELKPCAETVKTARDNLEEAVRLLFKKAEQGDVLTSYAKAGPCLEAMGDVVLGWLHLWQLTVVHTRLTAMGGEKAVREDPGRSREALFYYGKACGARFFIDHLLKRTMGKIEELKADASPVIHIEDQAFSG